MAVVTVMIRHLAPMPWSDGWWRRGSCSTPRVTVLIVLAHLKLANPISLQAASRAPEITAPVPLWAGEVGTASL